MQRYLYEVVEIAQDCELGSAGERALVVELPEERYMELVFFNRPYDQRIVRTGSDYKFLRSVK